MNAISVNEIFESFDGEVNAFHQGRRSTFIRLQGCNMSCSYCDTKHSLPKKPNNISLQEIVDHVFTEKVTITGGEPLLQEQTPSLIYALLCRGHLVSVETNGSILIPNFLTKLTTGLSWIVDYKIFASERMKLENHRLLSNNDFLKIIVSEEEHIDLLKKEHKKFDDLECNIAISTVNFPNNKPLTDNLQKRLFDFFEATHKDWILNVQVHKFLGFA